MSKKINLIKVILRLECLVYQNIYISINLYLYSWSDLDSKNPERGEKKTNHICKIVNGFVNNLHLQSRQNIYFISPYFISYKIARKSVHIRHVFIGSECSLIGHVKNKNIK